MNLFRYVSGQLYAEGVPVKLLADRYGTPLYIYSYNTLLQHFDAYDKAFAGYPHIICYSVKSNPNLAILRCLSRRGSGADIVSGGELFRALKAGVPSKKIIYAGVGKTSDEIKMALRSNVLMFNVESDDELREISKIACMMKKKAPIALRINPDIDPGTHPYISTGLKSNKFGIPIENALDSYNLAAKLPYIEIIGIHKHIGSQITKITPFVDALRRILTFVDELKNVGIEIKYLDIGGGLGIPYDDEDYPMPQDLAKKILPLLKKRSLTLVMEPGRSIIGNAGVLLTEVLYMKKGDHKNFAVIDAGMNDLIRPSLYGAYHKIVPVISNKRRCEKYDVVGPICESGDFIAKDRSLNSVRQGELLAVMSAGAYGFAMSSNYNSRPRAAEVLVKDKQHFLIRARETYQDLMRKEKMSLIK
jgi:diaminopimelate decarboxylase